MKNIEIECIFCDKVSNLLVRSDDMRKWENGMYIQDAFPYLDDVERELLLTGICGDCFDDTFSEVE